MDDLWKSGSSKTLNEIIASGSFAGNGRPPWKLTRSCLSNLKGIRGECPRDLTTTSAPAAAEILGGVTCWTSCGWGPPQKPHQLRQGKADAKEGRTGATTRGEPLCGVSGTLLHGAMSDMQGARAGTREARPARQACAETHQGVSGRRDWNRTNDLYHVKVAL